MQQQFSLADSEELVACAETPVAGPVLLDLSLQALVSGGSPKGGWEVGIAFEADPSPTGGW
jgi:hypothetical protein